MSLMIPTCHFSFLVTNFEKSRSDDPLQENSPYPLIINCNPGILKIYHDNMYPCVKRGDIYAGVALSKPDFTNFFSNMVYSCVFVVGPVC